MVILLALLTTPLLPLWLAVTAVHPRLRKDLAERWGVRVAPVSPGAVWVHAASVGEMSAAEALIPHLDGPILLTADTDTGAERARAIAASSGGRVVAQVRPVDHPWTLAPLWAEARPRAILLVEGTYWPVLALVARASGVPVVRVSAKAGARTRRWGWLRRLDVTSRAIARDDGEAAFFRSVGIPADVGGDLKGDRPLPPSPLRWARPFVVGCSTRPGEEELLVDAVAGLGCALLLAPRHPDRFDAVARILEDRRVRWRRRTSLQADVPGDVDVVLLDTIGELAGALRGASAAFVGGTFDADVGGHSPAEAGRAGVPVVAGPHVHANAQAFRDVGARVVQKPEDVREALRTAMTETPPSPWSNGAAQRTAKLLEDVLAGPMAPESSPRPWLWPVAVLWLAASAVRWAWDDRRAVRLGVPVVSVGSANARGPGKTSTARWVARGLQERGHVVGVAVRGYRRSRPGGDVRLSTVTKDAADLGDEGALLARELLVAAGPDRVACGRALVAAGATVIVLEDGLQVRRVHRDVDLVVVDARFPRARGPIPVGERRLWDTVPKGVTGVVAHHGERLGAATAIRKPGPWFRGEQPSAGPDGPVMLVCGVARPQDVLATIGVPVARLRVLKDHADVDDAVWDAIVRESGGLPIVCTAKDYARWKRDVFWRDVDLDVTGAPERWFPKRV